MRVVLFDGVCALCTASVRCLVALDENRRLQFAPLQGDTAANVLRRKGAVARSLDLETILYVRALDGEAEEIFDRSDAVIEILHDVGGLWKCLVVLRFLPRPLRDGVYRMVAKRRYRWFGRYDTCRLPGADTPPDRFLP